jgi:hypothetical protein
MTMNFQALERRLLFSGSTGSPEILPLPSSPLSRQFEHLDRGVVATRSSSTQVFVTWRLLATDPSGVAFNVYRSASGAAAIKLNASPLTEGTNYTDTTATLTVPNAYSIRPVVSGVEQTASASYTLTANSATGPFYTVPMRNIGAYDILHLSVGDLDGDGKYDFVVDRRPTAGNGTERIEAYRNDGTFMWSVDCGPNSLDLDNIEPGSSSIDVGNWDGVQVYDMDGDGKAEVLYRSAHGVVFGDGTTLNYPASNDVQFISVINGITGAERARIQVPTDYIADGPSGAMTGIGYLDGVKPSLVVKFKNRIGSGDFNLMVVAYDFDGTNITQKWKWRRNDEAVDCPDGHNIRIVDVDGDGKDEVCEIGYVLNGDGTLKYSLAPNGIVHGDRWFIGDFDPARPGLEGYGVQQNNTSLLMEYYYDAATGTLLNSVYGTAIGDNGRGDVGDVDPAYPGAEYWSFHGLHTVTQNAAVNTTQPWPHIGLYWDGDVQIERIDTSHAVVDQWVPSASNVGRVTTLYNYGSPSEDVAWFGDLTGDWREEAVYERSDHQALVVFTTQLSSSTRLYSLAQNPLYRNSMTLKGYKQTRNVDYYLGGGMTTPPAPNITVHGIVTPNGTAPTVATQASVSTTVVTGTSVNLSVLGADDGGESNLVYSWSAMGGSAVRNGVTFSSNASNGAKNTVATFSSAGTYTLTATIRDASGQTTTSSVNVVVNQTLSGVLVSPTTSSIPVSTTQQFNANAIDQFGDAMTTSLSYQWLVTSGSGTISSTGLYTAAARGGTATIQAQSGSMISSANLTITPITDFYQAESSTYSNVTISTGNSGYRGTGYADYPSTGGSTEWSGVNGGDGGQTTIVFRYALPHAARTGRLTINGVAKNITFPQSGAWWSSWGTLSVDVSLLAGLTNTIKLESTGQDLGNVDELQVNRGAGFNNTPTVATPASATPDVVTGTTTGLSVLGTDDAGESGLIYTWAATGPVAVQFSANGTNASKNTIATFAAAGVYTFAATIRDAAGLINTSSVVVYVNQTLTSISISPSSATVSVNESKQFTATARDQFGGTFLTSPSFNWSVISGAGSINAAGLYTAPGVAGSATVQVTSGTISSTALVTIASYPTPRAHWKLDETSGTTVSDSSGNANTGTSVNGPVWTSGKIGNALSFDGVDDFVTLPNSIVSSSVGSVSMWVKTPTNFADSGMLFYSSSVSTGNGGGAENELHLNYLSDERIQFFIEGGSADVSIVSASTYADNAWHHLAATWDINGNAILYIDGAQAGYSVHDANNFTGSARTYLGRPAVSTRYYTGLIDEVRLFNVAIGASQIQALYSDQTAPAVSSSIFAFDTAPNQLKLTFSEPVTIDQPLTSLVISRTGGGTVLPTGYTYDALTSTVIFDLSSPLTDGDYQVSMVANRVRDAIGNVMPGGGITSFFVLSGDVTRDRKVNTADFNVLASNFGSAGVFSQGDLSYDGSVDSIDFGIFVQQYGKSLVAPATPLGAAGSLFSLDFVGSGEDAGAIVG